MIPSRPPTLDTLTITPAPCSSIRGRRAKVSRIGAKKLTRMTASTSGLECGDSPALGDCGIVDEHIDLAEGGPRLQG